MILVETIQALFTLTLLLAIVRYLQTKIDEKSSTGKALAWIYH
jgi:hypothetical protein